MSERTKDREGGKRKRRESAIREREREREEREREREEREGSCLFVCVGVCRCVSDMRGRRIAVRHCNTLQHTATLYRELISAAVCLICEVEE